MSTRTIRINELVQRELSSILRQRYQSESVAVTITEVRVSPDLRDARVFISVVAEPDVVTQKLRWIRRHARAIRDELGRRIVLKFLPKFEYVLDETCERGTRIQRLLDQLPPVPESESPPPAEN